MNITANAYLPIRNPLIGFIGKDIFIDYLKREQEMHRLNLNLYLLRNSLIPFFKSL